MNEYQKFIASSRYARWVPEKGRRETWPETVSRYIEFWRSREPKWNQEYDELEAAILNLEVMPSMRCLMTAGPALEKDNVAGFNCSYLPIDHPRALDELMYILMCGTGVGFSVERQYVDSLPDLPEGFFPSDTTIAVPDSKVGWAKSYRQLLSLLWAGEIPKWDMSRVRPSGEPLKTFGGRASGPEPLDNLFHFTVTTFTKAAHKKLTSLEVHDLCCAIAAAIVVGGVRRSALISLSNPSDDRLRSAKSGDWHTFSPQRSYANNSACYSDKPELRFFLKEMRSLYESKSGERGFFSRAAAQKVAARNGRRDPGYDFGTNPCSEIILRPNQFCNLSEVVVRAEDTLSSLKEKVRQATVLGTLQATLTDFRYLRAVWKRNTEEEALLGVSLTGIMDHPVMSGTDSQDGRLEKWLEELREVAIETNKAWADRLGINPSAAITCVKPSGTVSQLVNSASGIHPRFSPQYLRTVRADKKDPLAQYMVDAGFPHEVCIHSDQTLVFGFPVQSEVGCRTTDEIDAMEQLRLWKIYQDHWCEHKPSVTVYYRDSDYVDIFAWIWKNFDAMSGISLLPLDNEVYKQAPYQPLTKSEYSELASQMPSFDWEAAAEYEREDATTGSQELACVGGACEL